MNPKLIIEVDIQEDGKRAENMMNQIKQIIDDHRGQPLSKIVFDSIVRKIEHKTQYFTDYNFPPMFILVTMYGVALVDKKQKQVKLAEQTIMSPNYKITKEHIQRGSIL